MRQRIINGWAVHLLPGERLILYALVEMERGRGLGTAQGLGGVVASIVVGPNPTRGAWWQGLWWDPTPYNGPSGGAAGVGHTPSYPLKGATSLRPCITYTSRTTSSPVAWGPNPPQPPPPYAPRRGPTHHNGRHHNPQPLCRAQPPTPLHLYRGCYICNFLHIHLEHLYKYALHLEHGPCL